MKTLNFENSLLVEREGATIPIASPSHEQNSLSTSSKKPLMKQAKFRRLFNRHELIR